MEPQTALAFKLAEHFAGRLMAPSTLNALAPYFAQADQVLADTPSPVRTWPEKIRTITRGQSLIPPEIDQEILHTLYEGLFNDRQIEARYQRRYDGQIRDYRISPLGVVFRDGVVYLICQRNGREGIVHLAMHRFLDARVTETPVHRPADFDLDAYVRTGGLDFRLSDGVIELELRVAAETAVHLQETPLSRDQTLTPLEDGDQRLRATVPDTAQIRWWLLGLGDNVEVIAPALLRAEIRDRLEAALSAYR
jgi:predicted DNA-binding transcriptional regulator YafY